MPNNKMERFTRRARRVLAFAEEEAERLQHNTIGTEHLLLGILHESHGIGSRVLRDFAIESDRLQTVIQELTASKADTASAIRELSPETKRVVELSVDEARRLGKYFIDTEHLLLALVNQSESVAIDALKRLGITAEAIRKHIYDILEGHFSLLTPSSANPLEFDQVFPAPQKRVERLNTSTYEVLQNVLMKILDMIATGKLPTAQGIELFNALTPDLKLAPIQQAEMISHLFEQKTIQDYTVRLTEVDSKGVKQHSETTLPLANVLHEIDRFLAMSLGEADKPLIYQLGDTSLELRIEKGTV